MRVAYVMRTCLAVALGTFLAVGNSAGATSEKQRAEQKALREAVRLGKVVPLQEIIADALRRLPGKVLEVDVDLPDDAYEIEVLDAAGKVWELEYRASTGELLEIERD